MEHSIRADRRFFFTYGLFCKRQDGFTLVELMITTVILLLAIAAASGIFTGILNQFKQQAKIGETGTEGIVGLEILRSDIEEAGYGLPWGLDGIVYAEAANAPASDYNDEPGDPPRAIVTANDDPAYLNNSDALVIKASSVAINFPAREWAYVSNTGAVNVIPVWENIDGNAITYENLESGDFVIVLRPTTEADKRVLVNSFGTFRTVFNEDNTNPPTMAAEFSPIAETFETYMIYGIDPDNPPRMPFNRADYYISTNTNPAVSTSVVPDRCAPSTGVLVKAVLDVQRGGGGDFDLDGDGIIDENPLLDCVADMQIILRLDMDDDGVADTTSNADGTVVVGSFAGVPAILADAALLREALKEVSIFILAHEGQRDPSFTYVPPTYNPVAPANSVRVGPRDSTILGRDFDLSAITDYLNYRWKVYSIVVKPYNLEG